MTAARVGVLKCPRRWRSTTGFLLVRHVLYLRRGADDDAAGSDDDVFTLCDLDLGSWTYGSGSTPSGTTGPSGDANVNGTATTCCRGRLELQHRPVHDHDAVVPGLRGGSSSRTTCTAPRWARYRSRRRRTASLDDELEHDRRPGRQLAVGDRGRVGAVRQVRLVAYTGTSWTNDMAIDNFAIFPNPTCSLPTPARPKRSNPPRRPRRPCPRPCRRPRPRVLLW